MDKIRESKIMIKNSFFSFLFFCVFVNDSEITIFFAIYFGNLVIKIAINDFNDMSLPKRRPLQWADPKSDIFVRCTSP